MSSKLLLVLLATPVASCQASDIRTLGFRGVEEVDPTPVQGAYRHPLLGIELDDGGVPGVDVHDSPDGQARYVIGHEMTISEEGGTLTKRSGVFEADVEPFLDVRPDGEAVFVPVMSPALVAAAAKADPSEGIRVVVGTTRPEIEAMNIFLARAIGEGLITDHASREEMRHTYLALRSAEIETVNAPIISKLSLLDANVVYECEISSCLVADVPAAKLTELAEQPGVERIDIDVPMQENAGGNVVRVGAQIWELLESPGTYDGEGPATNTQADDIWGAVIESCRVRETHYVFNDISTTTTDRFATVNCTSGTCVDGALSGATCDHATYSAGTVIGDTEDGQISGVSGTEGAGFAPEARAMLYQVGTLANMVAAFDHIPDADHLIHAANMSISLENQGSGYECSGTESAADLADALFENGTLLIMAAGNDGGVVDECRVEQPGSANTVFTIGGHGTDTTPEEADIRSGNINSSSAWGGFYDAGDFSKEGRGRTIIEMTAPYWVENRPDGTTSDTALGGLGSGTSIAAPVVTGTALSFVDWYKQVASDYIDDPGPLFVSMLLMTDRQEALGKRSSLFSRIFGGGRLKTRRFDTTGLDDPWYTYHGQFCIEHGCTTTIPLNGGVAFPADVDDLKAVAWWYDPGFHSGNSMDNVDMSLVEGGATLRSSSSDYEDKEMIYYNDIGDHNVSLKFDGVNVTTDVQCGTNSVLVYFFLYAEDGDREGTGLDDVERM